MLFSWTPTAYGQENNVESIRTKILKVKGDQYYPPYEYINSKGKPDGFNVELFAEIAKELELQYTVELGPWNQVREELENGQVDVLLGLMISPKRAEKIVFGVPHSVMTHGIFTHKSKDFRTLESLRGKEVIVQDKDLMHDFLIETGLTDKIIPVVDQLQALKMLALGKHDAALLGNFQGSHLINEHHIQDVRIRSSGIDPQKYAMAVSKENEELIWLLNQGLYQMKVSGVYDELYTKWFAVYEKNYFLKRYRLQVITATGLVSILLVFLLMLRYQIKRATRKLRLSEEVFRKLYEDSSDPILLMKDGRFINCNKAALEFLGVGNRDDFLGSAPVDISPSTQPDGRPTEEAAIYFIQKANNDGYCRFEWMSKRKDGMEFLLEVTLVPIVLHEENMLHVTWRDITQRKQAEIELQKAKEMAEESDRLKTAFLNNMSHEIRTPLNGILGFTNMLNEPETSHEDREYYIRIINQSSQHLLSIIEDIINIATIEAGQEKLREGESNVNQVLDILYHQFRTKLKSDDVLMSWNSSLPENRCTYYLDETKLIQVLTNLIGNAIKFTRNGIIAFGVTQKEEELHFYVKDTGIGIPETYQSIIFDRFRQVVPESDKLPEGNGLGLAISKAYVELMGGRIWVQSEPGIGSTFYFTLLAKPVAKSRDVKEEQPSMKTIHNLRKTKTILLAEDEYSNFLLVKILLQPYNFNIIHVTNGHEAVEACQTNQDISLVLMDLKMPGLDGFDATSQIKKDRPELPIIAVTAYALGGDKERALQAGCEGYIAKPFRKSELLLVIQKYLNDYIC